MPDREKVIAWLTEISLRPCDFTRDDFNAVETERLANDAIEIVEDAEIFCKQRNDALVLLKEQEAVEPEFVRNGWRCGVCGHVVLTYCFDINEGEMGKEMANYCPSCGRKVKWE